MKLILSLIIAVAIFFIVAYSIGSMTKLAGNTIFMIALIFAISTFIFSFLKLKIPSFKISNFIKNFILKFGQEVLNTMIILGTILSIVSGISMLSHFATRTEGLILIVLGPLTIIMSSFVIYLLIDIRDQLKKEH